MTSKTLPLLAVPFVVLVIFVIILLVALLSAGSPPASGEKLDNESLSFTISLAKFSFAMGEEEVPLTMSLQNASLKTLTVNQRLAVNDKEAPSPFREVTVLVRKPSGGEAEFRWDVRIGFPGPDDFAELGPGQMVQRAQDLAKLYALDEKGEYEVVATYENSVKKAAPTGGKPEMKRSNAVLARIESNTLRFRID